MIDLDAVIRSASSMRPLPQSAQRLARLLAEEDWELAHVAEVVRLDAPLTGRALGLANSASMGYRAPTSDVHQAVMRLGPGAVLSMAIGSGARDAMSGEVPWLQLERGRLWRHSVATALAVEQMPAVLRSRVPAEAFAAALLHDVGKIVLAPHVGEREAEFLRRSRTEGRLSLCEAEREIFEVTHAEVGGLVAARWGLPAAIVVGIVHHHDPKECVDASERAVAEIVALANQVGELVSPADVDAPSEDALEEPLDRLRERVRERLDEVLQAYA